MTTIRLFPPDPEYGLTKYRAILGKNVFLGDNAGSAVGAAINLLQEQGGDISAARIFVQKIGGDEFFSDDQIARMKALIAQRDSLLQVGKALTDVDKQELESLIVAELEASSRRVDKWNHFTTK